MKIHECTQGTTEWLALRSGIPTSSDFDRIITKSGKVSTQAEKYLHKLLAERIMGRPVTSPVSYWQGRGQEMEAEAVSYFEGLSEQDTTRVGFITNDSRTIGTSPDRLVGSDGLLEIKVPSEHVHVSYLLTKSVDAEYYPQCQGQMWIAEKSSLWILSYHPEMPPALVHVERDEVFITKLQAAVGAFSDALEVAASDAKARGWIREPMPLMLEAS